MSRYRPYTKWSWRLVPVANTEPEKNAASVANVAASNADEPSALDYNTDYKDERLIDLLYSPDPYRAADHDPLLIGLNLGGAQADTGAGY